MKNTQSKQLFNVHVKKIKNWNPPKSDYDMDS